MLYSEALLSVAQTFFEHVDIGDESIKVGPRPEPGNEAR